MKSALFAILLCSFAPAVFAADLKCIDTVTHAYEVRVSEDLREASLYKHPFLTDRSQKLKLIAKFDCRRDKGPIVLASCKEQGSPENAYWFLLEDTVPSTFPELGLWKEDSDRNTRDLIVNLSCFPPGLVD